MERPTYAYCVAFRVAPSALRKNVDRSKRCHYLAVARRISQEWGERLDAERVAWRWIRWIGQGPSARVREERYGQVLAMYAQRRAA
jgi:hypothetical protein